MQVANDEAAAGLRAILQSANRALRRFPGVLLAAALATGLVVYGVLSRGFSGDFPYWGALATSLLGISWIYCLSLVAERHFRGAWRRFLPLGIGILSLSLYYWRIRGFVGEDKPLSFVFEYAGLALALHFFAAYAPFLGYRQAKAFWEYNRAVFLRFLLALLFSATLWLGVALLLAALSRILPDVSWDRLGFILSACILGIFNTWFFLAGVPEDFDDLERNPRPYPRALRAFAQFLLLPLAIAFLLVLALWILQRMASGLSFDPGLAGAFLALGAFGVLTYLLLYPLEGDPENRWLRIFSKGFFLLLLPFLGLLAIFAIRRVQDFGWTPLRYYALLLTLWGFGLSAYLVLLRNPRITWIPISLSLLALVTAAGPWGALALTRSSQNRRMLALLDQPLPLDQAKLAALDLQRRERIMAQASYLEERFGCEELLPYFGDLLRHRFGEKVDCSSQDLNALLQRDPSLPPQDLSQRLVNVNFLQIQDTGLVSTQGYDFYFPSSSIHFLNPDQKFSDCYPSTNQAGLCVRHDPGKYTVEILRQGRSLGSVDLEPSLGPWLKKHLQTSPEEGSDPTYRDFKLPPEEMSFPLRAGEDQLLFRFEHIRLEMRGEQISPEYFRFSLLFKEGT